MSNEVLYTVYKKLKDEIDTFRESYDFSEYKPNVGVFGENSTGKSTFLNALLGNKDEFKMGLGETTDAVKVLFSDKKTLIKDKSFIYKKSSYPHLKYMNIYDLPGFGQKFSHNKLNHILKSMGVLFWLIDASSGIKKEDDSFINILKDSKCQVIVVFNKLDRLVSNEKYEQIIKYFNIESFKIYDLFKKKGLEENLIGFLPFSATKSLVNVIKNDNLTYTAMNRIINDLLVYAVLIESYRDYENYISFDGFYGKIESEYRNNIKDAIIRVTSGLENKLKKKINFLDSLNPFGGKEKVAKPIVKEYLSKLKGEVNKTNNKTEINIKATINREISKLEIYNVFVKNNSFTIPRMRINAININIDLDSIAWNSFRGDSFAEEVSSKFKQKVSRKLDSEIYKMLRQFKNAVERYNKELKESNREYAKVLDDKLKHILDELSDEMLNILVKDSGSRLSKNDKLQIGKIIHLNNIIR